MGFDHYKVVLYATSPGGWVAEIPSIAGYALMPTAKEALTELLEVFRLIELEHQDSGQSMPRDTTEILHT